MIVTCPNCNKMYQLDERRLASKGAAVGKCADCGHRFTIEPPRETSGIVCPKCGHEQPGGSECVRCGVVFGKLPPEVGSPSMAGGGDERSRPEAVQPDPGGGWPPPSGGNLSGGAAGSESPDGFSISGAIRYGWKIAKSNVLFFIALLIMTIIVQVIPSLIGTVLGNSGLVQLATTLMGVFGQSVVTLGLTAVTLKFVDEGKGTFDDLFSCFHLFWKYLGSYLLFGGIMLIAFIPAGLLIFLSLGGNQPSTLVTVVLILGTLALYAWIGLKFFFFTYSIVDEESGPIEALKRSSTLTKGAKWELLFLSLLLVGINILGAIPLLLGLLLTVPTTLVAFAHAYRQLTLREKRASGIGVRQGATRWQPGAAL